MTRRKRGKKRPPESVLESVFGIKLEAVEDTPAPNPQPEVNPAVSAAEARAEKVERRAQMAEIRAAAADVARIQGIKPQRAHSFVKLLDLSGVGVNSDGEPDEVEIARLVRAGVEEYPELTTGSLYGRAPNRSPHPSVQVGG